MFMCSLGPLYMRRLWGHPDFCYSCVAFLLCVEGRRVRAGVLYNLPSLGSYPDGQGRSRHIRIVEISWTLKYRDTATSSGPKYIRYSYIQNNQSNQKLRVPHRQPQRTSFQAGKGQSTGSHSFNTNRSSQAAGTCSYDVFCCQVGHVPTLTFPQQPRLLEKLYRQSCSSTYLPKRARLQNACHIARIDVPTQKVQLPSLNSAILL